jgi:hypothetical protein
LFSPNRTLFSGAINLAVEMVFVFGLKSVCENQKRSRRSNPEMGGSPLLQQREATLQRCGRFFDCDHAL